MEFDNNESPSTNDSSYTKTSTHHMSVEPLPGAITTEEIDSVIEYPQRLASIATANISSDKEETEPIMNEVKQIRKAAYKPHYTFLLSLLAILLLVLCATIALSGIYRIF